MRITFILLSLLFMLIDEPLALYSVEKIYGNEVMSLFLSPWVLIPYSFLVFLVEYLAISAFYQALSKFLRFLRRSKGSH